MKSFMTLILFQFALGQNLWTNTDDLENHISPEDLEEFQKFFADNRVTSTTTTTDVTSAPLIGETTTPSLTPEVPSTVDCFGLGPITGQLVWFFNMKPDSSEKINTQFFFVSRKQPMRVQVVPGEQFGLEWVDFNATRKTVVIIHGFMSHSNATWVNAMSSAFLQWDDVNVITVDWSRGGNTWKYWRAVVNTRRVGADVTGFLRQLMQATGARPKDFHFVGHSLGAHICSYVSYHIGGVHRITGLDPAQPCFRTTNKSERLDDSDADFVDIIHTNGRLLKKIGFGLPEPVGHADFYPNGGMKQPGCKGKTKSIWNSILPSFISMSTVVLTGKLFDIKFFRPLIEERFLFELEQAICSHGRAYLLFTESLLNKNCTFRAHQWNLTYKGVNASLEAACDRRASCSEMGIAAIGNADSKLPRARGTYFVLTRKQDPYCPSEYDRSHPYSQLLQDLQQGFEIAPPTNTTTPMPSCKDSVPPSCEVTTATAATTVATTTKASFLRRLFG